MAYQEQLETGRQDLESLEFFIRGAMHDVGRTLLETLLKGLKANDDSGKNLDKRFRYKEERTKTIVTVLGKVEITRSYYYDQKRGEGVVPLDRILDVVGTTFSPGMRRIMGRVGVYQSFGLGHEDIKELAGIEVTAKEIERISEDLGAQAEQFLRTLEEKEGDSQKRPIKILYATIDGTGVPVVKKETLGRQGKGSDGQAKTREAKLGCIFTQTGVDKDGYAVRDEDSTTYFGKITTAEEFGKIFNHESLRRGSERAEKVCMIGDAAPWIWNIAQEYLPQAIQIIDLYHAREHYWNVARLFWRKNTRKRNKWAEKRKKELNDGAVHKVIRSIGRLKSTTQEQREVCRCEMNYFDNNKHRMHYDQYRRAGLFVGSGVIEAGCRTVIGQRLKQSGMHWTVRGANTIIALRCCLFSHLWEDFWAFRAAA
jgi:hypothetical protein